ncbi:MAG: ParB/RepB/Spo0J family partition protein [Clostridia bacterium]|nr:ParB/RepB/Spo0J family partition protein [Clostridia bacterium]
MLKNRNNLKKSNEVVLIPARQILPNPHQPRKNFNWDDLEGLAESIHHNGLLQPITVRRKDNGRYELISGERRLRACKMAGLSAIPAIIIEIDEEKSALLAVIENIQRENLHFFEEAMAIERLIKGFGLSQDEVSRKLGKSQSTLSNKLRILRLPDEIRYNIMIYGLTERHARALLRLPSTDLMNQVIDTVVEQGLTVTATEQLICEILTKQPEKEKKGKRVMVFKDVRIFINTLNHAVSTMRKSGINAKATKNETDDYIEYIVKINKPQNQ